MSSILLPKLAAELAPKFPDAQIYLDLRGMSENPLTAAEALSYVVRAFHPEAKLPEREDDLYALFRHVLHNKRALLLIDNAKNAAQVKSLVPPEGCALILTSRFRFTLPGLLQKSLDTLPSEDARELLLKIAPSLKREAEAIAKLCGYLALALRLAATAIAEHIDLAPAVYRQKLADEKQRLKLLRGSEEEGVDASIALSYNLLDVETQKHWRMLGAFPDTFDPPAAAAIWEIETDGDLDEATATLSRLVQYSMLEWNDSTKRYRLHDLMRDFARQRQTLTESDGVALRHARYYVVVLQSADDLYKNGGDSTMRGLALFDLELRNIQAGQAWAAFYAGKSQEAVTLCSAYPRRGTNILYLRQSPRDQIRWLDPALTAARQLKDSEAEGRHLGKLGLAFQFLGDYRRAHDLHAEHLSIARETGDRKGESASLGNLGRTYADLGDYGRAIEYHEKLLAMAREFGDRKGEGYALCNLGVVYSSRGDHRRGIEHFEQHTVIAREIGDPYGEGNSLWNMSVALNKLGDRKKAIDCAEAALRRLEGIESPVAAKVRKRLEEWRSA